MIELTQDLYLSRGRTRECYVDPRDPQRCIKVDFRALNFFQTDKEALYYAKLARLKPDLAYDCIPRFHGMVETSKGKGGVFDMVTDEGTNQVSKTLRAFIDDGSVARSPKFWDKTLKQFVNRLLDSGVIVRDLRPANLCARKMLDGSYELVAIDGIGHRDFIPLCDYFPSIARRKSLRLIERQDMVSVERMLKRHVKKKKPAADPAAGMVQVSP